MASKTTSEAPLRVKAEERNGAWMVHVMQQGASLCDLAVNYSTKRGANITALRAAMRVLLRLVRQVEREIENAEKAKQLGIR